ncbi:phosphodiester glycosidase family protein [Phaeovulum vinaykumarii]|uniref:Uncharacterized protein YigE, DUF2233 family n=1 Tax=Phaeovulum vinaykumarii TaxID=407234 RepID=A0A1N7KZ73_9RHOB|nr:phosphodiester glycosidase family protein [Phaeovulum vinaykumarii]SIS66909.1 Uncharacterized protein YigE, DUF2233 family [Phaeovulum vinaykumarii]SOC00919.1 uncharacterized protein YigE [Phaeovulum vinaykumarii]
MMTTWKPRLPAAGLALAVLVLAAAGAGAQGLGSLFAPAPAAEAPVSETPAPETAVSDADGQAVAAAAPCRDIRFEDTPYTVCEIHDPAQMRIWLTAADGLPVATFERLRAELAPGETLLWAMNAGMYHPDRRPVGLFIGPEGTRGQLVTSAGPGNFGMLPNGVFCATDRFAVIESRAFAADPPACRIATQSGPMLVIDGALHPRFLPDSTSRHIRNGIGVSADGQTAWAVLAGRPVTLHAFARLFRDELGAPNALYLDGSVSRLTIPATGRADLGVPMGPILGAVAPAP